MILSLGLSSVSNNSLVICIVLLLRIKTSIASSSHDRLHYSKAWKPSKHTKPCSTQLFFDAFPLLSRPTTPYFSSRAFERRVTRCCKLVHQPNIHVIKIGCCFQSALNNKESYRRVPRKMGSVFLHVKPRSMAPNRAMATLSSSCVSSNNTQRHRNNDIKLSNRQNTTVPLENMLFNFSSMSLDMNCANKSNSQTHEVLLSDKTSDTSIPASVRSIIDVVMNMNYAASVSSALSIQSNDFRSDNSLETRIDYREVMKKTLNGLLLLFCFVYAAYTIFSIDANLTRGWTQSEIAMRIPIDTWSSYESSLEDNPIYTKTLINVIIYLLGDWLSQTLFQKKNILEFDAARTMRNGFIGLCFGPLVHEYYQFSDYILPVEGGTVNRIQKIAMDQSIYLVVKCSMYIMAIGLLNGEKIDVCWINVKKKITGICFTAWKFWPLVHLITYNVIPARHRILWVNCVDLVWNAILASKAAAVTEAPDLVTQESSGTIHDRQVDENE